MTFHHLLPSSLCLKACTWSTSVAQRLRMLHKNTFYFGGIPVDFLLNKRYLKNSLRWFCSAGTTLISGWDTGLLGHICMYVCVCGRERESCRSWGRGLCRSAYLRLCDYNKVPLEGKLVRLSTESISANPQFIKVRDQNEFSAQWKVKMQPALYNS